MPRAPTSFEYFGLRTLYDRYLLRHPTRRSVLENPQYFWMRIAVALTPGVHEAIELYQLCSALDYIPSSPTLFNAGTRHEQLSSCFLLDSPEDSLESIYDRYKDVALLSKFSGGIGIAWHRVRSEGSLIRATNGLSNGIVPWLKTLDSSVAAVNQGGKRKGAACAYLEPWHADIESFLELRDNTGDDGTAHPPSEPGELDTGPVHAARGGGWPVVTVRSRAPCRSCRTCSGRPLMRPTSGRGAGPGTQDAAGARTVWPDDAYPGADRQRLDDLQGQVQPRLQPDGAARPHGAPVEPVHRNPRSHQRRGDRRVQSRLHQPRAPSREPKASTSRSSRTPCEVAVRQLDRVIDLNFYPIGTTRASNMRWRPVGLGIMGLQDVFFRLRLAFDSEAARALSTRISRTIYFHALHASSQLAREYGAA